MDTEGYYPGGAWIGGDPLSWEPAVWEELVRRYSPASVLDVGCGEGYAVRWFDWKCGKALGIDGDQQALANAVCDRHALHDYTQGPCLLDAVTATEWDLVVSTEFVEHVAERYLPNFLDTFKRGKRVCFTHAVPGQIGIHHVNCRTDDYWLGVMAAAGFEHLPEDTRILRELSQGWFKASGLVFNRF